VVEHGQRVAPVPVARAELPLEIGRPQIVGRARRPLRAARVRLAPTPPATRRHQALAHETVEFFPVKEKQWEVKYGPIVLGLFDEGRKHLGLIRPGQRQRRR